MLAYTPRRSQLEPAPQTREPIVARCECGNSKSRGARSCATCAVFEAKPDTSGLDAIVLRAFEPDEELLVTEVYERLVYRYPRYTVACIMRRAVAVGALKRRKVSRTIGFVYSLAA